MRRAVWTSLVLVLVVLALACGVTVSGRIDVGPEAGTPCPGGTP